MPITSPAVLEVALNRFPTQFWYLDLVLFWYFLDDSDDNARAAGKSATGDEAAACAAALCAVRPLRVANGVRYAATAYCVVRLCGAAACGAGVRRPSGWAPGHESERR
ncbi:hypothetical protein GUJ93_ZPchr0369g33555 [Zizania palustris]|uniref:Uncharacterized protein n=1 Tax=Zizania palustris TaxID=103762 RepID=A0A8J6C3Y4_ZIZPA|nr:hypothetical protein GUJ93_ZPchr0369g33555 [Zizania palustris]